MKTTNVKLTQWGHVAQDRMNDGGINSIVVRQLKHKYLQYSMFRTIE